MEKVDAYVLGPKDYEEIPELTEGWFRNATLHIGGVPVKRGRPKLQDAKQSVSSSARPRCAGALPQQRARLAGPDQRGVAEGREAAEGQEKESVR